MAIASDGYVILLFLADRDDETRQYMSRCEELGIASCGDTIDEAFEALNDAAELYLNALEEEGQRERVFAERGITILHGELPAEVELPRRVPPCEVVSPRPVALACTQVAGKRTPLCSSDDVCRALARAGFEPGQRSRGGSHQKWRKVTEERTYICIVVLSKREIPRGTLESIIAQAGMTVEEFITYLR